MKRILAIIALILLVGYLVASLILWGNEDRKVVCEQFYIVITDSLDSKLVQVQDLYNYLEDAQLLPLGKNCGDINIVAIEQHVAKIDLLKDIECYYKNNGDTYLVVSQRQPIMRVYSESGETYYLDNEGKSIAVDTMYQSQVPLVTGYLDDKISAQHLIPMVQYIAKHEFWAMQVSQVYVSEQQDILLYPRVGEHIIVLGDAENYEQKLDNVLSLYNQVMPRVGWAVYDTISVKYKNQVVCTRKNKKYRHNVSSK